MKLFLKCFLSFQTFFRNIFKPVEAKQTEQRQTSEPSKAARGDLQKSHHNLLQWGQPRTDLALQWAPLQRTLFNQFGSSECDRPTIGIPQKGQRGFVCDLGTSWTVLPQVSRAISAFLEGLPSQHLVVKMCSLFVFVLLNV